MHHRRFYWRATQLAGGVTIFCAGRRFADRHFWHVRDFMPYVPVIATPSSHHSLKYICIYSYTSVAPLIARFSSILPLGGNRASIHMQETVNCQQPLRNCWMHGITWKFDQCPDTPFCRLCPAKSPRQEVAEVSGKLVYDLLTPRTSSLSVTV